MSKGPMPGLGPEFCENCGAEMENDIDYEGRGVSTCPECPRIDDLAGEKQDERWYG